MTQTFELTIDEALRKGIELHNAGDWQEAERVYRAILQSQPAHPDANHNLGLIAVSVNNVEAALPLFKVSLDINPSIEQFWVSYIDALIKANQSKNAKRIIKKAKKAGFSGEKINALELQLARPTRANPEGRQIRLESPSQEEIDRLLASYQSGQYEIARDQGLSITKRFPSHQLSWKVLGALFGQVGQIDDALIANQNAAGLDPDDADAHFNLGITLTQIDRLLDAESSYRQAVTLRPDFAEAFGNLGNVQKTLGRLGEAEASYRCAIKVKPGYADAHYNLGNTFKELGRPSDAEVSYRQAIALNPVYSQAYSNLGFSLQELGRSEEALLNFRRAIELTPDHFQSHSNLGVILKKMGRSEEAEASCRQAIALAPGCAQGYNNLGSVLNDLGRLNEAEVSYRQAIAFKEDYAEAHSNLGANMQDLGNFEDAEASFRRAILIDSGRVEAIYNLGILLYELRNFKEAAEQLRKIDFAISNAYLLRCVYMLDQQSDFYNLLGRLVDQGENNAVIGSLISRSNIRYGLKKPNPFCSEPLKYVVKANLLAQCDFKTVFVEGAATILSDDRVQHKNQGLLTNGIQTAGNVFTQVGEVTDIIQAIIRSELEKYRVFYKDSKEGLITSWPETYRLEGWFVSMKSGGELNSHMHENGWISGSVYINVPPKSNNDSGNLVVQLDDTKNRLESHENMQSIDVVTGSLCLFPSSLHHYTIPFKGEEDRVVLAFDVIPDD